MGVSVPTAEPTALEDHIGGADGELAHTVAVWAWGKLIGVVVFALVLKWVAAGGAVVSVFRHWDGMFPLCG